MRLKLIFLLFCLVSHSCFSQSYYAIRNDGELPKGYILDKVYQVDKTILLNQPSNQTLSAETFIPFNFYYYNSPVSKYKVSENGYLTFDVSSTSSIVPDTNLPTNSIVAFGRDFKLQKLPAPNDGIGTQVFSYTVGQAPNRSHIIQFYGLSLASNPLLPPINNTSIYAFAIVLHEGPEGRFDLVYSPYGNKNIKGAIGCKSVDQESRYLLHDSLNFLPFQFSFELDNFIVYQFRQGIQPEYDLVIKSMELSKIYPVNTIVNFNGKMSNWGKKPVHSFYVNYSINQGDTISHLIDGLNLLPGGVGNMDFGHPVSWLSGSPGLLNGVNVWLSAPDNNPDGDSANSNILKSVLRNNNSVGVQRNILLEEGTGAWCGYCPDAHLIMAEAVELHGKRVVPVAYHFDDSMSNNDGYNFLSRYISSYPDALIDRKIELGSNSNWLNNISSRLAVNSYVDIQIDNKSYNLQTRTISYTVKIKFSDFWYGNLRIGSIVTENNVRGNANPNIWSQNNYYSKDHEGGVSGASHPLYNELEYMDGYLHQYVHKASPGGVWGVENLMPELISPDIEYSVDFSYVVPPAAYVNYSSDNNTDYCNTVDGPGENEGRNIPVRINLIAFVAEFEDDFLKREILNAFGEPLWDLTAVNSSYAQSENHLIYPNPSADQTTIKSVLDSDEFFTIELYNSQGQFIKSLFQGHLQAGENLITWSNDQISDGLYLLRIKGVNSSFTKQLLISR